VQAAELARESGAKLLALTHLSSRYHGRELEREATEIFSNSFVAKDFDRIEIPVEEKGLPKLVREKKRNEREHSQMTSDEPGIVSDEV
jgi:ribonuclease Z